MKSAVVRRGARAAGILDQFEVLLESVRRVMEALRHEE